MAIDWTPLSDLIQKHDRFLVTSHVRPDGDALGSEVGMAGLLRLHGKDVRIVNSSPTPPRYDFLDPNGTLFEHYGVKVEPASLADRQALVILDLSSWSQLGDMAGFVREFPGPRLVVDHHVSSDDLGATVLKDVTSEATAALVWQAVQALKVKPTAEMARGLLTGLAMDTGWFRHGSTRPETLRAAADLMEAGAEIDRVYRLLFERNTMGRLKMVGEALSRLETICDGRVAYTSVTLQDFQRTGAIPPETEDLVDYVASLAGIEIAALFIEQYKGGLKVSLRARGDFDCASLAALFGGGGHRAAAGAHIPDALEQAVPRVLEAIQARLNPRSPQPDSSAETPH